MFARALSLWTSLLKASLRWLKRALPSWALSFAFGEEGIGIILKSVHLSFLTIFFLQLVVGWFEEPDEEEFF